jgi:omega-amidase
MRNLRITLVQAGITWHDAGANLERFDRIIGGIEKSADCVILPEMFTTGFTMKPDGVVEDMEGPAVTRLKEWAERFGTDHAGSVAIRDRGRFYNRLVWARPDGTVITYDKRHLFRMAGEDGVYSAGGGTVTIDHGGWKIRPFICYDLRFPVWTRNRGLEYDAAVFVANWPDSRALHWKTLLRARAIENQCYVIGVNRVGIDGNGVSYSGGSTVIDFAGNVIVDMKGEEGTSTVELSCDELRKYRETFPAWKDADPFILE